MCNAQEEKEKGKFMTISERQKQTTINVQEKANLIWAIADKLVGVYKPHEYGKVILPMCVIKRFSDALVGTRQAVWDKYDELKNKGIEVKDGFLKRASGYLFYNTSKMTLEKLLTDEFNIGENFRMYLQGFSENVIDILNNFKFEDEIKKMEDNGLLYLVISEFCSQKADLSPDKVTSTDMGYIFEELVRKFSESYDEQAGAHFTARDIIYLMSDILIGEDEDRLREEGITATVYDMAMGTSQMLGCMTERLLELDKDASIKCFGQELNEETFAIAKADMLIKGGNAENMKHGDTLSNDQFADYTFDYIISNPPFGIEWKKEKSAVENESKKAGGRFSVGLPPISDGQMLFMLNGIAKLKDTGRMAIIQNGSPMFSGDAGSGQSEIRGYLLENDWLEAIIQLPNDMFYNTGIATYIWVVSKNKPYTRRAGKVQLIDVSNCYEKRRKSLGNKRNEFTSDCIDLIKKCYVDFVEGVLKQDNKQVESKIFANDYFKYSKVVVERPLRDEKGELILKKGKMQADPQLRDSEIIPWGVDHDEYMQKNVLPYAEDAWIDESKTKIGYEIPFTRLFYKYVAPRKSEEIFDEIKELESQETALMKELFG